MALTPISIQRVQVGEIPGPVGLVCADGETVWAVWYTDLDTGLPATLQLCVANSAAPCDATGLFALLEAGNLQPVPAPCP